MSGYRNTMGAGLAGSRANVNVNTSGGNKKGGLPPYTNAPVQWINRVMRINADQTTAQRNTVFHVNQMGGIGRHASQFGNGYSHPRGVSRVPAYNFKLRR